MPTNYFVCAHTQIIQTETINIIPFVLPLQCTLGILFLSVYICSISVNYKYVLSKGGASLIELQILAPVEVTGSQGCLSSGLGLFL